MSGSFANVVCVCVSFSFPFGMWPRSSSGSFSNLLTLHPSHKIAANVVSVSYTFLLRLVVPLLPSLFLSPSQLFVKLVLFYWGFYCIYTDGKKEKGPLSCRMNIGWSFKIPKGKLFQIKILNHSFIVCKLSLR